MGQRALTIEIPDRLFNLLEHRAKTLQRTVQEESVITLASKLLGDQAEEEQIERALATMESYSDQELWAASRGCLTQEDNDRTADLNYRQQAEGLTIAERVELSALLSRYDWHVLIRSKALALLKERGHDIAPLLVPPLTSAT